MLIFPFEGEDACVGSVRALPDALISDYFAGYCRRHWGSASFFQTAQPKWSWKRTQVACLNEDGNGVKQKQFTTSQWQTWSTACLRHSYLNVSRSLRMLTWKWAERSHVPVWDQSELHVNAPLSPWHTEPSVPVQATLVHQRGHTMGLCPPTHSLSFSFPFIYAPQKL